jgi:capsule polysaccharide export protein KpsC/LpsZ
MIADPRTIVIGFRRWRAWVLGPMLRADDPRVRFVRDVAAARRLRPAPQDRIVVWGAARPPGLPALLCDSGATLVRVEDGFIRSVGLGSDLIAPRSLVFDTRGIHFDATRPSGLEHLLRTFAPDRALIARAAALRETIVARHLTKYNVEGTARLPRPGGGRPVVLVPGQVDGDASIAWGAGRVRGNAALLAAVRAARPDAFIVYKPHPDVLCGNRRGAPAAHLADHVETRASILSCLAACDEVHTITSQAGFDALLRGIPVVTYGMPFYAGWGLTRNGGGPHPALARRDRVLTLDELVAGALLLYPRYWDPATHRFVTAESAVAAMAAEREALQRSGTPDRLIRGFWAHQRRKIRVLARAWLDPRGFQPLPAGRKVGA